MLEQRIRQPLVAAEPQAHPLALPQTVQTRRFPVLGLLLLLQQAAVKVRTARRLMLGTAVLAAAAPRKAQLELAPAVRGPADKVTQVVVAPLAAH
jgi:hypothetical protein